MKSYTVKMSNAFTGKTKTRVVLSMSAYQAEMKARSNVMMANGWVTDEIKLGGIAVSIYQ